MIRSIALSGYQANDTVDQYSSKDDPASKGADPKGLGAHQLVVTGVQSMSFSGFEREVWGHAPTTLRLNLVAILTKICRC